MTLKIIKVCKLCKGPLKEYCDSCSSLFVYAHDCISKETFCLSCYNKANLLNYFEVQSD